MTVAGAVLALFVGAVLQSATGFGFALVSAPILFALLGPREAVTAGAIVAILLNGLTLATEGRRPQVLVRDAVALVAWSLPGLAIGVLALHEVPRRPLSVVVALAVLAGLALRVRSRRSAAIARPRGWHVPVAGLAAGALGTSTSLNGPPLVFCLLARPVSPRQTRDTLAAIFLAEAVLGLPALLLSSTFTMPRAIVALLVAGLAGQLLGRRAFGWLRGERYERAVLAALALTAIVAVATSIA
ncbi:MAG: uncharacterized protein QOG94_3227 [Solirubrobacteraceae bacterium]|nr:uncharacterized protein [Solirubrobacteraceae bacterium]